MFTIELTVRDYECDMQGIVNNAVYMNYFEHARHVFLKSLGLDFATLTSKGIYFVLRRAEIDYLKPLKSGMTFKVTVVYEAFSKIKSYILQTIEVEGVNYARARFLIVALNDQLKPIRLDFIPRQ